MSKVEVFRRDPEFPEEKRLSLTHKPFKNVVVLKDTRKMPEVVHAKAYDRVLTADEVRELYDAGPRGME